MTRSPNASPDLDPENWYVAQLRPNMRLIAERNLTRQGFASFAPTRLETTRTRGRLKTGARPLFPGYLFIQFNPEKSRWQSINATRGIVRLVADTTLKPIALPADFMAGLMSRCDANGLLHSNDTLNPGDQVRLLTGPFAGLVSRIDRLDQQQRLHLLIQVMGRQVRTSVPTSSVGKMQQPEFA